MIPHNQKCPIKASELTFMDSGDLLKEPADFVAKLERERDALKTRNHTMCDGLKRLVARASASVDFMMPVLNEGVTRCTLERSNTRARLAMAMTQGDASDVVEKLKQRILDLDAELESARQLRADASRLIPLIDELRSFSGVPAPCTVPPEKMGQMEMPEKCPLRVFRMDFNQDPVIKRDPTRRLLERIKKSGATNLPSAPEEGPASTPVSDTPVAEPGPLNLQNPPGSEQEKPFKKSLFGKLVSFR